MTNPRRKFGGEAPEIQSGAGEIEAEQFVGETKERRGGDSKLAGNEGGETLSVGISLQTSPETQTLSLEERECVCEKVESERV